MAHALPSLIWTALAGMLAANLVSPAPAADKVVVGTGGSASDAPFYIAYDRGFFKDERLDVDLIVLDSGAKVIAPLGTGELDVGSGALSVGFWNALVRGVKFRIVADRGHTETGYRYQSVFMRKDLIDGGQFKIDSIKGGKIAGSGADDVVQTMAKSFNMNPALVREMYSQAVDVTGDVNAAGIQKDLDFFLAQGWVTGQAKASDVIDMSFARNASATLGAY